MCLIVLAHQAHSRYRLVVAANRDEFYARPTAPAQWWSDAPHVLAGRDLRGGGTWMGITRAGRFAAITNVRETTPVPPGAPSRGALVSGFLLGAAAAGEYAREAAERGRDHAGFNLLVGDGESLWYTSNRAPGPVRLRPGVYGLSNAALDTPWPKVVRARHAMHDALAAADGPEWNAALWRMLADRVAAADHELPQTGVGAERERVLSSPLIVSPEYGTRASTLLTITVDGEVHLRERTLVDGAPSAEARFTFALDGATPTSTRP
ncbi:MAG TPA: NRDE family protein [Longimicrobium sp.]|uniref:NRDE family protein n=1 Tax=Longimicrobium sp. TaxID=2029185 RepID=UPI002EDA8D43